jgi:hypothetical protein
MKLPRRILDLVRTNIFAWRGFGVRHTVPSSQGMPTELQGTQEVLAGAEATRQRLQGALEAAEREGRDRDARLLRRQVQELSGSIEQLQAALELIRSRAAMAQGKDAQVIGPAPISQTPSIAASDPAVEPAPRTQPSKPDDLEARKARLSGGV